MKWTHRRKHVSVDLSSLSCFFHDHQMAFLGSSSHSSCHRTYLSGLPSGLPVKCGPRLFFSVQSTWRLAESHQSNQLITTGSLTHGPRRAHTARSSFFELSHDATAQRCHGPDLKHFKVDSSKDCLDWQCTFERKGILYGTVIL
jgi:hypothetical protein